MKFLKSLLILALLIPSPVLADHVPTQTPYGISIACDSSNGDVTVTWQESDGFESSPPERYAIAFSNDNFVETNYAVANSTGWEEALSYKSYVFTASYRETIFGTTADTFYAKVRADNDTDASYSEWTSVVSIDCDYGSTPSTTTSTTTSSTTTTTTTTTTLPPPPPPPPPTTTTTLYVVVMDDGTESEYTESEVKDGTVERDQERIDNEKEYGCFMTNAQIERGDCIIIIESEIIEDKEKISKEEIIDEIITEEIEEEVELIILEDDVDVLDPLTEEKPKDEIVEVEEQSDVLVELEEIEIPTEIVIEEEIIEVIIIEDKEEIEEDEEDKIQTEELEEQNDTEDRVVVLDSEKQKVNEENFQAEAEITEEEILEEISQVEDIIVIELDIVEEEVLETYTEEEVIEYEQKQEEAIQEYVQDLTSEEKTELIEEVNDVGVQNLDKATPQVQKVVQAVVVSAVKEVEELTEEQVEIVSEVLKVEKDDVAIYATAAKKEKAINTAVEEYVERSVANKDVENYNLADVVSEVNVEMFLESPISVIIDVDLSGIEISSIGADMAETQKDKVKEIYAPVLLTQIVAITRRRLF